MTFNNNGLEYPENIYCDAITFHKENQARCYYYHNVSTDKPDNSRETMDYLLENFFARRGELMNLIDYIYKRGQTLEETAEKMSISSEAAEEKLKQFYRDLLYFPRYNDIFSKGIK